MRPRTSAALHNATSSGGLTRTTSLSLSLENLKQEFDPAAELGHASPAGPAEGAGASRTLQISRADETRLLGRPGWFSSSPVRRRFFFRSKKPAPAVCVCVFFFGRFDARHRPPSRGGWTAPQAGCACGLCACTSRGLVLCAIRCLSLALPGYGRHSEYYPPTRRHVILL